MFQLAPHVSELIEVLLLLLIALERVAVVHVCQAEEQSQLSYLALSPVAV